MEIDNKTLNQKLDSIKNKLNFIKANMVSKDTLLDNEDISAIETARNELENKETISLDKIKKEFNM